MKTMAVVNQKGGVWKTTTAVTLAHGLALVGRDVLLVDLDAQGNVADALGLEKTADLHALLTKGAGFDAVRPSGRARLDVVLGDRMTADAKRVLGADPFGVHKLRDALEEVAGEYDVCILDAAPGADILQMGALVACDYFLVPVALAELAVVGAVDALTMVASLRKRGAFQGEFLGVLPTHWDRRTNEGQYQLEQMQGQFQRLVWPPIPMDVKASEAPRYGRTLLEYAPEGRAVRGVEGVGGYLRVLRRLAGVVGVGSSQRSAVSRPEPPQKAPAPTVSGGSDE